MHNCQWWATAARSCPRRDLLPRHQAPRSVYRGSVPGEACLLGITGCVVARESSVMLSKRWKWAGGFKSVDVCSYQPVGCDGLLYSTLTVDRCGVCGGNGTSCQRVSGSYRKALAQLGNTHTNTHPKSFVRYCSWCNNLERLMILIVKHHHCRFSQWNIQK